MKRLANLAQGQLALDEPAASPSSAAPAALVARFVADGPEQVWVGRERGDQYLRRGGLGWVVRLRAVMATLDYTALLVAYTGSGRRPFHPRTLLGLIIYGILQQQWSLRQLEALAVRDVGAWWMTGGHQPDHSTLGAFIVRHQAVLTEEFFVALVAEVARRVGVTVGVVAGDGTVIEAAASRYALLRREAVEQAAAAAAAAAATTPTDAPAAAQAAQCAQVAETLAARSAARADKGEKPETTQIVPHEPDAVLQPRKDGAVRPAYKPSALVHEGGLIVAQAVHPSSETAVVPQLLAQHARVFGGPPACLLLDANYHTAAVLQGAVAQAIDLLCPAGRAQGAEDWTKAGRRGCFGKGQFHYDAGRDAYRCPAGAWLEAVGSGMRRGRAYRRYATGACTACALRARCTRAAQGRTIERYGGDEYKEAMALVWQQPAARARYRRRAAMAERPFAELRGRQGLLRFRRRGTRGAAVEFALHCIAFDLKWALGQGRGTGGGLLWTLWVRITDRWILCRAAVLTWAP